MAAVVLVAAIGVFLAVSHFRRAVSKRDIPQRLGINIQQEASGVTYTQNHGGRTIFKIHASQVVQLRNSLSSLKDVTIEIYGDGGKRTDRIEGSEFEYDQSKSIATAAGAVNIVLDRPGGSGDGAKKGQIQVETSGITFDQSSGMVTTNARVKFTSAENSGSAVGASYNSESGLLELRSAVRLEARRGANTVNITADQGELDRTAGKCTLRNATAESGGGKTTAAKARIVLRQDGTVERLDAWDGLTIATASGSRLSAPSGTIAFNTSNQPGKAHLEGGVAIESVSAGRTLHGGAPRMDLDFATGGNLSHAHLERGVVFDTSEQIQSSDGGRSVPVEIARRWRSPVAEIEFRSTGRGRVEPAALHGSEGVEVTGETRRPGAAPAPFRMAADDLTAQFGARSALTSVTGKGHATLDETTATGSHETATAERLEARFAETRTARSAAPATAQFAGIENAILDGRVVLVDQPAAKPGTAAAAPMRATAGHATYDAGAAVHLSVSPHVSDGGMDVTADRVDVDQRTGDAFAHGNVKGTWTSVPGGQTQASLGGSAPTHIVASEAEIHRATGEARFTGKARLWQDQNSISAPTIVLDHQKQTLTAQTANAGEPVAANLQNASTQQTGGKPAGAASLIRVRGGSLIYSSNERRVTVRSAPLASVTAETGAVESSSDQLEVYLAAGNPRGAPAQPGGQVERIVSSGHVSLSTLGRRGTGNELVYTAETGLYVLTGTAASPPRIVDPERGTVTGEALLFNGRDDSVRVEGGSSRTRTETTAPR